MAFLEISDDLISSIFTCQTDYDPSYPEVVVVHPPVVNVFMQQCLKEGESNIKGRHKGFSGLDRKVQIQNYQHNDKRFAILDKLNINMNYYGLRSKGTSFWYHDYKGPMSISSCVKLQLIGQ